METLTNKFNEFTIETRGFVAETSKTVNSLQTLCNETQFQLKEIKDYVDHFGDNLILNSQQIIVDTHTGFSNRPVTLTEVLRICRGNFDDITQVDKTQDERLEKAFAEIDSKAPDSILFNIATLEKKVGTIELHIQKEEEQGLGVSIKYTHIIIPISSDYYILI